MEAAPSLARSILGTDNIYSQWGASVRKYQNVDSKGDRIGIDVGRQKIYRTSLARLKAGEPISRLNVFA